MLVILSVYFLSRLSLGMVYYTLSWAFADLGGDLYLNFVLASLVELPMHAVSIICLQRYPKVSKHYSEYSERLN